MRRDDRTRAGPAIVERGAWSVERSSSDSETFFALRVVVIQNPNRTFLFNMQFFTRYRKGYDLGQKSSPGPYTFLGTLAISTGYFQDRLNPSVVFVFDAKSKSGSAIASVMYRITQSFSIDIGIATFMGGTDLSPGPINSLEPASNQQGPNAYRVPSNNGLSALRDRDEIFVSIRYTF